MAWLKIKESRGPHDRLDVRGAALSSVALLLLLYALINGDDLGWTHRMVVAGLSPARCLLASFVVVESRATYPVLPLHLLRRGGFATSISLHLLMAVGLIGTIFLATQYFQNNLGYSPLRAGLAIAPAATLPVLIAPFSGMMSRRFGTGSVLAAGRGLQAAALSWLSAVTTPHVTYARMLPGLLVLGAVGLFFGQIARVILRSVPAQPGTRASPPVQRRRSANSAPPWALPSSAPPSPRSVATDLEWSS